MVVRNRSRTSNYNGTRYNSYDGKTKTNTATYRRESCDDTTGLFHTNNAFVLQRSQDSGGILSGTSGGVIKYTFNSYPCDFAAGGTSAPPLAVPVLYAQGYRTAALARTGLSSPRVNLPLSIVELRDLPRTLRHAGDLLHKLKTPKKLRPVTDVASATLAWQFGWKPIIDDLRKLMRFHDIVEKRRRDIDRAFERQRGYSVHSTLNTKTLSSTRKQTVQSAYQMNYYATISETETERVWCSIWWTPRSRLRMRGSDAAKASAFKQALGLNARNIPLTVWKALPWTWLTDWFVNVSDTIQAIDNQIDYQPNNGCIMVHRKWTTSFPGATFSWPKGQKVSLSGFSRVKESKLRYPVPAWGVPTPTMRLPFLDNFKLSVLGSLAILKIAR